MIFEVPFKYEIGGLKEGNELNSRATRWECARIEVQSVSSDDAPIVAEWVEQDNMRRSGLTSDEIPGLADDGHQHVRFHDGRHWLPVLASEVGVADNHRLSADQFARMIIAGNTREAFKLPPDYGRKPISRNGTDPYAGYRSVHFTSRDKELANIARAYENLLVVDGMVYTLANEPMIVAKMTGFDLVRGDRPSTYMGTVIRIVAEKNFVMDGSSALFPLEKFADAISHCRRKNGQILRKEDFNAYNARREPKVDYPEQLDRPDSSLSVIETYARSFVSTFEKFPNGELPTKKIRLYADIRDGLALLPHDEGLALIENAAASLLEAEIPQDQGSLPPNCLVFLRGVVDSASARPVEIALDIQRSPAIAPR